MGPRFCQPSLERTSRIRRSRRALSRSGGVDSERVSKPSPTRRVFFRWGMVEEFNKGLDWILEKGQPVGEMRGLS